MGFLDKLRRKKDESVEKVKEQRLSLPTLLMHHRLLAGKSKDILLKENQSTNRVKV
jgi:hypothetical protein